MAEVRGRWHQQRRWFVAALLAGWAVWALLSGRTPLLGSTPRTSAGERDPGRALGPVAAKPMRSSQFGGQRARAALPGSSMEAAAEIAGIVSSSAGRALGGATVCALRRASRVAPELCTSTSADGRFVLLAEGLAHSVLASAAGHVSRSFALSDRAGSDALTLTLEPSSAVFVAGRVLDASGGPLVGAVVSTGLGESSSLGVATSDGSGAFRLDVPSGDVQVRAQFTGYSIASRWVRAPATEVTLVLSVSASLQGQVLDADDRPVASAFVLVENGNGLAVPAQHAVTDADGEFAFEALAPGGYTLLATTDAGRSEPVWATVLGGQVTDGVVLSLTPATVIEGVVQRGDEPCPAGRVVLEGTELLTEAVDTAGAVRIRGVRPGRYQLSVYCEGAAPVREELEIGSGALRRRWQLEPGLAIRGEARRANGEALRGARVRVQPVQAESSGERELPMPLQQAIDCVADELGQFNCTGLLPGEYECLLAVGEASQGQGVRVALPRAGDAPVLLTAPPTGSIRVTVSARERGGPPAAMALWAEEVQSHELHAARREGGGFAFDDLPLGTYAIQSASPRLATDHPPSVRLERDGALVQLQLRSPELERISGTIVDERGDPVSDAWVHATIEAPLDRRPPAADPALSSARGEFELELLPATYELRVTSSRGEATVAHIASGARGLVLELRSYAALSGTLALESGELVSNATLSYRDEHGRGSRLGVRQGRWTVPWIAPGQYWLSAVSPQGSTTEQVELRPGEHGEVALVLDQSLAPAVSGAAETQPPIRNDKP